jgi:NNP family nitrate/nitrite transporter-like MFS transporter
MPSFSVRNAESALIANTTAFGLCFAVWILFGPSTRLIAGELHIPASQAAFLKTLPILIGTLTRIPIGILTDRWGARRTFSLLMILAAAGALGLSFAASWMQLAAGALLLGAAGATFASGVQAVSTWTGPAQQGIFLGIFGAGNVGSAITTLGMPVLLAAFGWRRTFQMYSAVMALGALCYFVSMRDAPRKGPVRSFAALLAPLGDIRAWRFGLYYMATFGAFVAAALILSDLYIDSYHLSLKSAGALATTFTFTASLARIPGGKWSDRYGARNVMRLSLIGISLALAPVMAGLPVAATGVLFFLAGICMGVGMAACMRYVADYYPQSVGAVGGVVGALGGLGGVVLPLAGNWMKSATGSAFLQVAPILSIAVLALATQIWAAARQQHGSMVSGDAASNTGQGLSALQKAVETPSARSRDVVLGAIKPRAN